jgi:hypothetical protein
MLELLFKATGKESIYRASCRTVHHEMMQEKCAANMDAMDE